MSSSWYPRAETAADLAAVEAVNLRAFGRPDEAAIVSRLRRDPVAWLPGLSYVATTATGEVVAHALLTRCHVDDAPVLALGPCAVLPEYQRSGAGGAVVRAVLDAGRAAGEHTVVVLGHAEYYPRFGFRTATTFGIHSQYDGPYFMALGLVPDRPLPRGTIRYPAAWQQ
ncbi:GCN5-related N-acetyltransferase [Kribbella flavida DSM 17836]|uniref:GCN5-related N-acetyltransferase n=1 Tax=Kribbella flavida (strain DSM 17836 / JCM 10339 / NBRC 14399) TaxID=479435 RepID=D2PMX3_KRIFD|nr:N-acetyltransferase [Kribbella flavida]ADB32675.1 GCN5-related N-acetyltransferase [Kribbella flavida DSM 17836]